MAALHHPFLHSWLAISLFTGSSWSGEGLPATLRAWADREPTTARREGELLEALNLGWRLPPADRPFSELPPLKVQASPSGHFYAVSGSWYEMDHRKFERVCLVDSMGKIQWEAEKQQGLALSDAGTMAFSAIHCPGPTILPLDFDTSKLGPCTWTMEFIDRAGEPLGSAQWLVQRPEPESSRRTLCAFPPLSEACYTVIPDSTGASVLIRQDPKGNLLWQTQLGSLRPELMYFSEDGSRILLVETLTGLLHLFLLSSTGNVLERFVEPRGIPLFIPGRDVLFFYTLSRGLSQLDLRSGQRTTGLDPGILEPYLASEHWRLRGHAEQFRHVLSLWEPEIETRPPTWEIELRDSRATVTINHIDVHHPFPLPRLWIDWPENQARGPTTSLFVSSDGRLQESDLTKLPAGWLTSEGMALVTCDSVTRWGTGRVEQSPAQSLPCNNRRPLLSSDLKLALQTVGLNTVHISHLASGVRDSMHGEGYWLSGLQAAVTTNIFACTETGRQGARAWVFDDSLRTLYRGPWRRGLGRIDLLPSGEALLMSTPDSVTCVEISDGSRTWLPFEPREQRLYAADSRTMLSLGFERASLYDIASPCEPELLGTFTVDANERFIESCSSISEDGTMVTLALERRQPSVGIRYVVLDRWLRVLDVPLTQTYLAGSELIGGFLLIGTSRRQYFGPSSRIKLYDLSSLR